MSFHTLPNEILLIIFNYCNAQDLIQLSGVCKQLYHIASKILIKESNHLLITGQKSEKFRERCQPLLSSYKKKFYIHNNWKRGRYKSKIFYPKPVSSRRDFYSNCLQMTKNVILLVSQTTYNMKSTYNLCAFTRTKNGSISNDNVIVANCSTEILDIFVPCKDIIVILHGNGSIRQWTIESLSGRKYFNKKLLHSSRLYSTNYYMDVTPQNIIKGTPKGEIEVWKYIPEENSIMDKYIIPDLNLNGTFEQDLHFITFDPTGTKFAAEISQTRKDDGRFIIYDIDKCCTEINVNAKDLDLNVWCKDQILWKEPNDIIYLYEDYIIKIDVRTCKVVQKWNAPLKCTGCSYDAYGRFTCMSSDNQYAIITGTTRGKLILWDQRQSEFMQVYHNNDVEIVDCLQFDSSRMYVAGNQIYEFDFTKIY